MFPSQCQKIGSDYVSRLVEVLQVEYLDISNRLGVLWGLIVT